MHVPTSPHTGRDARSELIDNRTHHSQMANLIIVSHSINREGPSSGALCVLTADSYHMSVLLCHRVERTQFVAVLLMRA